jgi:hypothetical protein
VSPRGRGTAPTVGRKAHLECSPGAGRLLPKTNETLEDAWRKSPLRGWTRLRAPSRLSMRSASSRVQDADYPLTRRLRPEPRTPATHPQEAEPQRPRGGARSDKAQNGYKFEALASKGRPVSACQATASRRQNRSTIGRRATSYVFDASLRCIDRNLK